MNGVRDGFFGTCVLWGKGEYDKAREASMTDSERNSHYAAMRRKKNKRKRENRLRNRRKGRKK